MSKSWSVVPLYIPLADIFTSEVLDEADTLLDETFMRDTRFIVNMLKYKEGRCQFILVAATVTKVSYRFSVTPVRDGNVQKVQSLMKLMFPDLVVVQTSTLHKGVSGSLHNFPILKPGQDKLHLLRDVCHRKCENDRSLFVWI